MTKRDSNLVKNIKKLERLAKKADAYDRRKYETSPEGFAAETLDHIYEVLHETMIELDEIKKRKKAEEERERWEEQQERKEKKSNTGSATTGGQGPAPKGVTRFVDLKPLITTNETLVGASLPLWIWLSFKKNMRRLWTRLTRAKS